MSKSWMQSKTVWVAVAIFALDAVAQAVGLYEIPIDPQLKTAIEAVAVLLARVIRSNVRT